MSGAQLKKLLSRLCELGGPSMRPGRGVDFVACFVHPSASPEAAQLLQALTATRSALLNAATKPNTPVTDIIALIDPYLEKLWSLYHSVAAQPSIFLAKSLLFEWKSYLYTNKKFVDASDSHITYELAMILHMKAVLHYRAAKALIDADINATPEATRHITTSAGIMKHLAEVLLPRWSAEGTDERTRPLETRPHYCTFMHLFYVTAAQQMFALKGFVSNSPITTKLAISVVEQAQFAVRAVPICEGMRSLFDHLALVRDVFNGFAFKLRAEGYMAKGETGNAIACCTFGLRAVAEQASSTYDPMLAGLPRAKYLPPEVVTGINELKTSIGVTHEAATRDNNLVYFLPVPDTIGALPETLTGILAVKLLPYAIPAGSERVVEFAYDTTKPASIVGKLMNVLSAVIGGASGTSASEDAAAAEAAAAQASIPSVVAPGARPSEPLQAFPAPISPSYVMPPAPYPTLDGAGSAPFAPPSAPPAALGPDGRPRSDYDIARELDLQLNGRR